MVEQLHQRASSGRARYSAAALRAKAPRWLATAARLAAGFVYPELCPGCRDEVGEDGGLCPACWRETTFLAPPACRTCGAPVAAGLDVDAVCDGCAHAPLAWSRGAAALAYLGPGRRLTLALKHADRLDVAPVAAGWMLRAGRALVDQADVIAPAPLTWARLVRRRYNQSAELARELARLAGAEAAFAPDALIRTRWRGSQDGKTRAERFANVADAFAPGPAASRLAGARVLLIDDVLTTGATLSACAEVCRAAGAADVNVLVLARVARADWPT